MRARLEAAVAAVACNDDDAAQQPLVVAATIVCCLEDDPSSSAIPAIAQFVRESPWRVAIVQQLISTRTNCDDLLDALLPVVIDIEEAQDGADGRLELLTTFFALALRQVQSPEQSDAATAMALAWSERVLQVIYTLQVQTALEREVVRQVVLLLIKMESALPHEAEFKVLTLVWKVRRWKWVYLPDERAHKCKLCVCSTSRSCRSRSIKCWPRQSMNQVVKLLPVQL